MVDFKLNFIKELKEEKQKLWNENFNLQVENNVLQEKVYRRDYEIKQLQKDIENLKLEYSALEEFVEFIETENEKLIKPKFL